MTVSELQKKLSMFDPEEVVVVEVGYGSYSYYKRQVVVGWCDSIHRQRIFGRRSIVKCRRRMPCGPYQPKTKTCVCLTFFAQPSILFCGVVN